MSSGNDFGFWDNLLKEATFGNESESMNFFLDDAVETRMSSKKIEQDFEKLRGLTDVGRKAHALVLPVKEGTRVAFNGNLGVYLTMSEMPDQGSFGTVVSVRSASGDVTSHNDNVFVEWDDGEFRSVNAQFLVQVEKTSKKSHKMRVSSLGDLSDFLRVSSDTLVHKSTKDIWSFKKEGEDYVIERMLGEDDVPLKIQD